ncbi:MAG: hypothetical protein F2793_00865 [Actinobacteria bacterium]|uniref:Unannotated protein n=1 Tax=freshwater metagenome TaxID=449393 RepID=A0A6J7CTM9_9ZZZZ|nr:hypothetical protein [Actinomycetota bacterium]
MVEATLVHGAESVPVESNTVKAWVTLVGAQIAPVEFSEGASSAQPYSLAPWLPGSIEGLTPLLDVLRGDFFCLPFGDQPDGPPHGEPAHGRWAPVTSTDHSLTLHLDADDSGAAIDKTVSVRDNETVLYQEVTISGLSGMFNYGTHPILDFSGQAPASARISTSPMIWSSVYPGVFSDPAIGETQILQPGAEFDSLEAIPLAAGGTIDVSRYPTPAGHEDLVMMVNDPAAGRIGWSAAVFDGFVWFALKDIRSFPATLLWISNGGRTQPPWSGRFTGRMGIEDVTSHFADGLLAARDQPLARLGISTAREFDAATPVTLRTVQGVVFTPAGFGRVVSIDTAVAGQITLTDEAGNEVATAADWEFVLESPG